MFEADKTLTSLKCATGFGFDLVHGTKTLDLIKAHFPEGKYLFAGVADDRNIRANDLAASLCTLEELEGVVGQEKLAVSTSCSLLHTAVDLVSETNLDKEIKSWLAFAAQKVVEVNVLAKALAGQKMSGHIAWIWGTNSTNKIGSLVYHLYGHSSLLPLLLWPQGGPLQE